MINVTLDLVVMVVMVNVFHSLRHEALSILKCSAVRLDSDMSEVLTQGLATTLLQLPPSESSRFIRREREGCHVGHVALLLAAPSSNYHTICLQPLSPH